MQTIANPPPVPYGFARTSALNYAPDNYNAPVANAKVANVVHAVPYYTGQDALIRFLTWENTASGAGNVELGIYDLTDWKRNILPAARLARTGLQAITPAAMTTFSLTAPVRLRRNAWYWLAVWTDVGVTFRCMAPNYLQTRLHIGNPFAGGNGGILRHVARTGVAGGLPDPFGAVTYWNTETPLIMVNK